MKFNIIITKELIDKSVQSSHTKCLVAKAIKGLVGDSIVVRCNSLIYFETKIFAADIAIMVAPEHLVKLMAEFDSYFVKAQFQSYLYKKFPIDIPDEVINHLFQSHVDVAQKLADCKELRLVVKEAGLNFTQ